MIYGLDLFSGIGGLASALAPWVRTCAYCENDKRAQRILLSRMSRGEIDLAPIWDDVTTLRGFMLPPIDIIFGGFPCQDVSSAGLRKGVAAERTGLFKEILRIAKETKAPIIFLENVQGIRKFIPHIRSQIESLGYECRDGFLAAGDVGAPHKRQRWFLVAYSDRSARRMAKGRPEGTQGEDQILHRVTLENGKTADAASEGFQRQKQWERTWAQQPFSTGCLEGNDWNEYASFLLRMDHGVPYRSHRLRALGNSVVPAQAREAFKRLVGIREAK